MRGLIFKVFKLFTSHYARIALLLIVGIFLCSSTTWAESRERSGIRRRLGSDVRIRQQRVDNIEVTTTQSESGTLQVSEKSTITKDEAFSQGPFNARRNLRNTFATMFSRRRNLRREATLGTNKPIDRQEFRERLSSGPSLSPLTMIKKFMRRESNSPYAVSGSQLNSGTAQLPETNTATQGVSTGLGSLQNGQLQGGIAR